MVVALVDDVTLEVALELYCEAEEAVALFAAVLAVPACCWVLPAVALL